MLNEEEKKFLEKAIALSRQGMENGQGGPFGCVIVRNTAHAEVVAIRNACNKLGSFQLEGCDIYTSCEPCPMCLGAIYWARPRRVIFANTREEAASIEFDDDFIYHEINATMNNRKIPFIHCPHPAAQEVFAAWKNWDGKVKY